jgi:hypothetical protein
MKLDLGSIDKPATVREAVNILLTGLGKESLRVIRQTDEEDLCLHHMSLGRFIRNVFRLHHDNPELLADAATDNADDASMVVIVALWRRLRFN